MHEDLLQQQLLRKKLHPAADDWIDEHVNPAKVAKWDDGRECGLGMEEQRELWKFAGPTSDGIIRPMTDDGVFDMDYTLAEMRNGTEKVKTGLRRELAGFEGDDEGEADGKEGEEDEDEDEDQMVEDVMPAAKLPGDPMGEVKGLDLWRTALTVEAVLRFTCMGVLPQR